MRGAVILLAASIFFMAALMIGLSIPPLQGKVPPNGLYGFRTPKTLSDPSIWYAANRFAAQATIVVAAVMILLGVVLLLLERYTKLNLGTLIALGLAFEIVPMLVLIPVLFLYHRNL